MQKKSLYQKIIHGTNIPVSISIFRIVFITAVIYIFLNISPIIYAGECNDIICNRDSQSEDEYLNCNKGKQICWEEKISSSQAESTSLKSTISILNGQISLQELQISQSISEVNKLEGEVEELSNRIGGLSLSLDKLSSILIERIRAQYKQNRVNPTVNILNSESFGNLLNQYKYLSLAQKQTATAMQRAESQRLAYDEQKQLKEEKQTEVEEKKELLEQQQGRITKQKSEQQYLLTETKSNEIQYQKELARSLAEIQAIQSIIAGKGDESEVRDVNQGDRIASVISGSSVCSSGSHLHFEVVKDGYHRDPAGYLSSINIIWDNAPDGSFGFGGSWQWPLNGSIIVTQGYGMTYYARVKRIYGGAQHTGIDIVSKNRDSTVKSVQPGKLYRGSIKCGGGLLRYVKVEHSDNMSTLYLHVNY